MSKKLLGRFYFKKTDSGNLIGEFSHNEHDRNYTESADLDEDDLQNENNRKEFAGNYITTWQENSKPRLSFLVITPKHKHIYTLSWFSDSAKTNQTFWGEGMLCDGILIGDYRNFAKP